MAEPTVKVVRAFAWQPLFCNFIFVCVKIDMEEDDDDDDSATQKEPASKKPKTS